MIIQPKFAGYFGTLGLVPFKVKSFDGKVLAFHIVIIQTNGNSLLYLNECQHLRQFLTTFTLCFDRESSHEESH